MSSNSLRRCFAALSALALLLTAVPALASPPDADPPVLGSVTPTTATASLPVTLSVNFTDVGNGVGWCEFVEGPNQLAYQEYVPSSYGATFSAAVTFTTTGAHNIEARCADTHNTTARPAVIQVSADTTPPGVTEVWPTSATVGSLHTVYANYGDDVGVTACELFINGAFHSNMTVNSSTFQATGNFTPASAGTYSVYARCRDAAANWGQGSAVTITASGGPAPDTTPPTVNQIQQSSASVGGSLNLTATYSDNVGVTSCDLYMNGVNQGNATLFGSYAQKSYTFASAGSYNAYLSCRDAVGLVGTGPMRTITISAAPTPDTTPPTVGRVSPITATAGVNTTFSATYGDNVGVTRCLLYVNGVDSGNASIGAPAGGTATRIHQFSVAGTYNVYFTCWDAAGYATPGPAQSVTVSAAVGGTASPGNLMKLACPSGAGVNDPCKAVYYYGTDGRRHAFPNERTYFTWYGNFDGVVTVNSGFMASIPLGVNVTYRPGLRMVKFTTVNTVYAVARRGLLRPIASEAVAIALYGSTWNRQIDDLSDAFYANYTYGASINNASDFIPTAETAAVTAIDANL